MTRGELDRVVAEALLTAFASGSGNQENWRAEARAAIRVVLTAIARIATEAEATAHDNSVGTFAERLTRMIDARSDEEL